MENLGVVRQTVQELIAERDELALNNRELLTERNELAVENRQLHIKLETAGKRIEALEKLCSVVIDASVPNPYANQED